MQLRCALKSVALVGVKGIPVDVEVAVSNGLPGMTIVGMPDAAVRESQERVRAAIKACGFTMPSDKVVVNLAPSSIRKVGSGFDLPIAAAILGATGQVDAEKLKSYLWSGELSLEGRVRAVRGSLAAAVCARDMGLSLAIAADAADTAELEGLQQYAISSLSLLRTMDFPLVSYLSREPQGDIVDFCEIRGHAFAKRAMQIAAAGSHGVLLMGPPGSGKTMLARALPSILPPLSETERLEAAMVRSVAGEPLNGVLAGVRPFRHVHHSTSVAGLVGGGVPVRPGEISLAHHGVLFLDELAEFSNSALQALRQPMERGSIVVTRAEGSVTLPSRFALVGASNPCPCGYFGDPVKPCTCPASKVERYQSRIGGPMLDRFDMRIDVWRSDPKQILETSDAHETSSAELLDEVLTAREYRSWRKDSLGDSPELTAKALLRRCRMHDDAAELLECVATAQQLSGRGIVRVLSVARTIADMAESKRVTSDHVSEALACRLREFA